MREVGKLNPIMQFCFAMEIQVLARPISGSKANLKGGRKRASADTPQC